MVQLTFDRLATTLQSACQSGEHFTLRLASEQSQFTRFNRARVRQTGWVNDGSLTLYLMREGRTGFREFPFTGNWEIDWPQVDEAMAQLRQELPQLPVDPYQVLPLGKTNSQAVHQGKLLAPDAVVPTLLPWVADLDFTGIYAAGTLMRGYADSAGQKHWFSTDSYSLDYSLFTPEGQAVKGTLAGGDWDGAACEARLQDSRVQLALLSRSVRSVARGQYRTYLAPAAVADLVGMLSWGGVSEAALQQGSSCLGILRRGEKQLSPLFYLDENFESGLVPRFNEFGEVAPLELSLIEAGQLKQTLISSRTAREYGLTPNGAAGGEWLRSPQIRPGHLAPDQILPTLGTGLYVSNLHYLNWSDRPTGRITGMTRYACFWVEEGEMVGPIENLRFDDSLYRFWGENLLALTDYQEFIPNIGTYGSREAGGVQVPGMIVEGLTYTL
ncbi:TldD/PmbA family protein [Leptolyngbya sp. 'hensonii']|uniref:TldD/PmbA family protein n=1 Tax=Leptolyngbya sp. 'hensonii' TaxID=1922337 RepID=UPI00117DDEDB|nr:TldD/PmbA family protein [Leptolyngbya sp. 'hensonii']